MSGKNGNAYKGNAQKKGCGGRPKKEVFSDFDSSTDRYGKIINLEGGKGASVLLLNSIDGKPIHVSIRGIHHKRVWFKKEDLVVIRGSELWGKVPEGDAKRIGRTFEQVQGKGDTNQIIFGDLPDDYSDYSDTETNSNPKITTTTTASAPASDKKIVFGKDDDENSEDIVDSDGNIDYDKI
jgi:hypothetical protein